MPCVRACWREAGYNKSVNWQERISVDPAVCHGKACVKGTRVMASVILDNLASGLGGDEIAEAYHVGAEDIRAVLMYAAALAKERVVSVRAETA